MTKLTTTQRKRKNSPHQPVGRWIRPEKRLAIYLRDSFRCVYCLEDLRSADPRDVTLDHVKAKADGGSNHESNLVTACRHCNNCRQDKPVERFAGPQTVRDIKRLTARALRPFLVMAKALIADRAGDDAAESR